MEYKKANVSQPLMGLNNNICINPVYWCRLKEVWLSEEDVERKKCLKRTTFDMLGTYKCKCLHKRELVGKM